MYAICEPKTNTLTIRFKPGPVSESDDDKPGVILGSS